MRAWIAKRRRVAAWLISCLIGMSACAAHAGQALVYRVQLGNAVPSYLIGTMHSEDPRVTGLMTEISPLIDRVEVVAIELVPDAVTMVAIGAATFLPQDQRLSDLIGDSRFEAMREAAQFVQMPVEVLDRLKPWAAAVMLGMPAVESGRVLDNEIYLDALASKRRVEGLESAAEQLAVFDGMPLTLQLRLLEQMIKNIEQVPKQLEDLTTAYISGDLAQLEAAARMQYHELPPELIRWFEAELLDRRNVNMVNRAERLIRQQPTLVAVGAMHLVRDSGLVTGLRARGFKVERLRDSY